MSLRMGAEFSRLPPRHVPPGVEGAGADVVEAGVVPVVVVAATAVPGEGSTRRVGAARAPRHAGLPARAGPLGVRGRRSQPQTAQHEHGRCECRERCPHKPRIILLAGPACPGKTHRSRCSVHGGSFMLSVTDSKCTPARAPTDPNIAALARSSAAPPR